MPAEILRYRWFAKTYGWTPAQVDDLWEDEDYWLPIAEEACGEVARLHAAEKANRSK
jgi:hypothetical protein